MFTRLRSRPYDTILRDQSSLAGNLSSLAKLSWQEQLRVQDYTRRELAAIATNPRNLRHFERQVYSQNGEDGILEEIFRRIGSTDRYLVEFGAGDGAQNCTRHLVERLGWRGLWMEGSATDVQKAQAQFAHLPLTIHERFLTAANVVSCFQAGNVPTKFDLLVVDIDSIDYWLVQKITRRYQPRVIAVEYNAFFEPGQYWVMPNIAGHIWDRTRYYGASLDAMCELLNRRGYALVGCDSAGVNSFFVHKSLIGNHFAQVNDRAALYAAPKFISEWFGQPPVAPLPDLNPTVQLDVPALTGLKLHWAGSTPHQLPTNAHVWLSVELDNQTTQTLHSAMPYPVRLSYLWQAMDEPSRERLTGGRTAIRPTALPFTRSWQAVRVVAPSEPGRYQLTITLVQEMVAWFADVIPNSTLVLTIDVISK